MKKVKYIYFFLMLFFIGFHFVFPGLYFIFHKYVPTYQKEILDLSSMETGFLLNLFSVVFGSILIYFTKFKVEVLDVAKYRSRMYLLLVIVFAIGTQYVVGSYSNATQGLNPPRGFFIFYGMFFNLDYYFLFALVSTSDFFYGGQLIYVVRNLLSGSRSASLSIFLLYVYSLWSQNVYQYNKKYLIFFIIALFFSMFSFNWASKYRSGEFETNAVESRMLESLKVNRTLIDKIFCRISYLENSMLPIYYKKTNSPGLEVFYDKYSLKNQAKLVLNNTLPIKLFPFDVYPNQYYRTAFMKTPIEISRRDYTSINMTLPVYFYMYSNFMVAIALSGLAIWSYYLLTILAFKVQPLAGAIFIYIFYGSFLTYFDWIMIIKTGVIGILSIGVFMIVSKCEGGILNFFKKIQGRSKNEQNIN